MRSLIARRTVVVAIPKWCSINTVENVRNYTSINEGPYSFYRRILTASELIQLGIPDPELDKDDLKLGCRQAILHILELLNTSRFKELKQLYIKDNQVALNNYDQLMESWRLLSKKEKRNILDDIQCDLTINSNVTRV